MQGRTSCHPFGPPIAVTAERYYEIRASAARPKSPKAKSIPRFRRSPRLALRVPGPRYQPLLRERTPERLTTGLTAGPQKVTDHELAEPFRCRLQDPAAVAAGHLVHEVGQP